MIRFKQRATRNAKIEHFNGRVWCGYLTPVEIVSIIDEDGFVADSGIVKRARDRIKTGDSTSEWFYFEVPKGIAFGT